MSEQTEDAVDGAQPPAAEAETPQPPRPYRTARIDVGVVGGCGPDEILVDGQPLQNVTRGFTLAARVGEISTLELDLVLFDGVRADGEVEVIIPDDTRAALVRLGWEPPTGSPPRRRRPELDAPTEGLNFGEALLELLDGERVTRVAWSDRRSVLLVPGSTITVSAGRPLGDAAPELRGQQVSYRPHLDVIEDGTVGPWAPTDTDLLATDWKIL